MKRDVRTMLAVLLLAGCDNALVGGECDSGYENRDGTCVHESASDEGGGGEGGAGEGGAGLFVTGGGGWRVGLTIDDGLGGGLGTGGTGGTGGGVEAPGTAGHVVALGFDATTSSSGRTMLTNAALLSLHEPVRLLSLSGPKSRSAGLPLERAVRDGVTSRGRTSKLTRADVSKPPAAALGQLNDVVLVSGRALGATPTLEAGWPEALGAFVGDGGIVLVVADRDSGDSAATFLIGAGLTPGLGSTPAPEGDLSISLWTDAISVGATSPFVSGGPILAFGLDQSDSGARVALASDGAPVAVHWAVVPQ